MNKNVRLSNFTRTILPYVYFIGLATYWFYENISAGPHFNYFALGIIGILVIQLIIKIKILGASLGIMGVLFSAYMFLAVLSEFNEFKVASESAIQLITIGTILSLAGLLMGVIMTITNFKS
jgi:hypothetical protein